MPTFPTFSPVKNGITGGKKSLTNSSVAKRMSLYSFLIAKFASDDES